MAVPEPRVRVMGAASAVARVSFASKSNQARNRLPPEVDRAGINFRVDRQTPGLNHLRYWERSRAIWHAACEGVSEVSGRTGA